ncbi:MAG: GNAT family N-acetyltransferase [Legionellales bacterium]|nr:GNAT family N-acetyltransferase [Legionellales bacterium]
MALDIHFSPLCETDFPTLHRWFNEPHVQTLYSLRNWTLTEVEKKLSPYVMQTVSVRGFVVFSESTPIAYCQYCPIIDYPWPNQDFPDEIIERAAGLDLLMGEVDYIGKGFGQQIVETFLQQIIWPSYDYCLVDPDSRNTRSLRLFRKCGFTLHKVIETTDTLGIPATLQLMIKEKIHQQI